MFCINSIKVIQKGNGKGGEVKMTFGEYITKKRLEKKITLRGFARMLDISPEYVCNFEKNRKPAPKADVLKKIAALLLLNKDETEVMYDFAAKSKNNVSVIPNDLTGFINENSVVVAALRMAKDVDATDKEWQEFMEKLKKKKG